MISHILCCVSHMLYMPFFWISTWPIIHSAWYDWGLGCGTVRFVDHARQVSVNQSVIVIAQNSCTLANNPTQQSHAGIHIPVSLTEEPINLAFSGSSLLYCAFLCLHLSYTSITSALQFRTHFFRTSAWCCHWCSIFICLAQIWNLKENQGRCFDCIDLWILGSSC